MGRASVWIRRAVVAGLAASSMLVPANASAATGFWAFPEALSIAGSASSGGVSISVAFTGSNLRGGSVSKDAGGTVSGQAGGSWQVSITSDDVTCTNSGSGADGIGVTWGGGGSWLGYFSVDQTKSSSEYACSNGPKDALQALHGLITSCDNSASPAARPAADAIVKHLVVEQTTSSACGSITEKLVATVEQQDSAALPISGGAELESAALPAATRWKDGATKALKVTVKAKGAGRIKVTLRSGQRVLGTKLVTARGAGPIVVPVPLAARAVAPLLKFRAQIPITAYVAGSTKGLAKSAKLKR